MRLARKRRTVLGLVMLVLVVAVSAASGARPGGAVTLSVSDVVVTEGSGGSTSLVFTVHLAGSAKSTATVSYATANGTATAPADFAASSGTLMLSKQNRTRSVSVQVVGDTLAEQDETLFVQLSNASGATVADGSGTGTIRDDDGSAPPAVTKIAAAGDIACDPASPAFNGGLGVGLECRQQATSDLLVDAGYAGILVLGDIQYENGAYSKFGASYDPSWGRVKSITHPSPGNHEYQTAGAAGYYQYFGAAAGDPTKGYYSFDLGGWHLIALNSNCSAVGGCGAGSVQEQWLRADLAAHASATCTLAFWHHPRFSSGEHGSSASYQAFWQALYDANADVVLVGHDHDYERFAPQTPTGALDTTRGIRQFVSGSGGKNTRTFPTIRPNSEARDVSSLGILELTLGTSSYGWRFVPAVGSFTDSGADSCH